MTAVAIILAGAVLGLTGLCSFLAIKLVLGMNSAADARELAAQRTGEVKAAGEKIAEANASTQTAVTAEKTQEKRGDALEKELADVPTTTPGATGLDRLP